MPPLIPTLILALLTSLSSTTLAGEAEYIPSTRILTIPTVKIGNNPIYNARLKLNDAGSFDILSYSEQPPAQDETINTECTGKNLTLDTFNLIATGMTLGQANTIIGCKEKLFTISAGFSIFNWQDRNAFPMIQLSFRNNVVFSKSYTPGR